LFAAAAFTSPELEVAPVGARSPSTYSRLGIDHGDDVSVGIPHKNRPRARSNVVGAWDWQRTDSRSG
jgi:hypothetical protein